MKQIKLQKGITLMALIITIIVLLLLASVAIGTTQNDGIIDHAKNSKSNYEKLQEKETIKLANVLASELYGKGKITVEQMQKAINSVTDGKNAEVINNGETLAIKFNESNRYYEIDNKGNVEGPIELINDKNAGDLSKDRKYLGTEKSPYVINCIEDLVEFSKNYTKYESSHVILARTLDFNSIFSYNDCTTKEYGNLNGDETIDDIKTELTKKGDDCGGFTPIASFSGNFDGQGYKICNLYENREEANAGLFNENLGTIKNLGLENITLVSGGENVGGIAAVNKGSSAIISRCNVQGTSMLNAEKANCGLIAGNMGNSGSRIEDCLTTGNLKDTTIVKKFRRHSRKR